MDNILGTFTGFAVGFVSFLFLFKLLILDHTAPSDELAPGVVVLTAMFTGLGFAFVGYTLQNYWKSKRL
ncbi:hypothetical protein GCM10028806_01920 [Spirosoma terrae]|uniref:Uncharacterized protein n=1 Tax=Spirosoma terrae TaxID=1968276 RepID=A0A6L9LBN0_9BACT|nr:hypothetical protein [Spirosoma terrae]NDU96213.1 hypothetical protein [Spirosoma terrae]